VKAVILLSHPLSNHDGSSSFLHEVACEVGVTDFDKVVAIFGFDFRFGHFRNFEHNLTITVRFL